MKIKSLFYGAIIILVSIISFFIGSQWPYNTLKQKLSIALTTQNEPLAVGIKQTGNFTEALLANTEAYKNVVVQKEDDGLIIGNAGTPAGLYFRYKLNQEERYSVKITGKELSGRTTMRVRRNDGKPEYLRAPNGFSALVESNVNTLELLFYSDSQFSYRLSSIAIDSCPSSLSRCKNDDDLRNLILTEVPGLEQTLVTDRFEAAVQLLNWTSNNIDLALSQEIHDNTMVGFSSKRASEIYYQIFQPDEGGVWCGGSAVFFNKVARLFDFMSFTLNFGDMRDDLTHVTCIIAFPHQDAWRYFIFDPTFNFTFRFKNTKGYASVSELIEALTSEKYSEIYIDEKDLAEREYIAIRKDLSRCETLKYENDRLLVCSAQNNIRSYFQRHRKELIRNGYSAELPGAYLQLFKKRIFSIGSATEPVVSQNFSNSMQNIGIPVGMP